MSIIYSGGSPMIGANSEGRDVALRACARFQSISPHPPGQSVARIKYQLVGIAHSCAGLWL